MAVSLSGRSFLKLLDFTPAEIRYMLELSKEFKRLKLTNTPHRYLQGKNIVLLFEKTLFQRGVHHSLDGVHTVLGLVEHLGLLGREHLVGNFHLGNAELLVDVTAD